MFPILQWAPPLCFPVCVCVWYRQEQEALLKWKDRVKWRRVFWIIFHPLVPAPSPSPPCSCFTIELHSRDKGCDADINDGWQRARFYVWWPIKGYQKNSRKIPKKYPFFVTSPHIHTSFYQWTTPHPPPGLHIHFGEIPVSDLPDEMQNPKELKRTIFSAAAADQMFQPKSL